MSTSSDGNGLIERMRQNLLRVRRLTEVAESRDDLETRQVREAVRTLARNRVCTALRQLRAVHGLTYEELHARTGISQQRLWNVEYGDQRLTLEEVQQLAPCFNITVADLLGIDLDAHGLDANGLRMNENGQRGNGQHGSDG